MRRRIPPRTNTPVRRSPPLPPSHPSPTHRSARKLPLHPGDVPQDVLVRPRLGRDPPLDLLDAALEPRDPLRPHLLLVPQHLQLDLHVRRRGGGRVVRATRGGALRSNVRREGGHALRRAVDGAALARGKLGRRGGGLRLRPPRRLGDDLALVVEGADLRAEGGRGSLHRGCWVCVCLCVWSGKSARARRKGFAGRNAIKSESRFGSQFFAPHTPTPLTTKHREKKMAC
jgi:hypothetical protein